MFEANFFNKNFYFYQKQLWHLTIMTTLKNDRIKIEDCDFILTTYYTYSLWSDLTYTCITPDDALNVLEMHVGNYASFHS